MTTLLTSILTGLIVMIAAFFAVSPVARLFCTHVDQVATLNAPRYVAAMSKIVVA